MRRIFRNGSLPRGVQFRKCSSFPQIETPLCRKRDARRAAVSASRSLKPEVLRLAAAPSADCVRSGLAWSECFGCARETRGGRAAPPVLEGALSKREANFRERKFNSAKGRVQNSGSEKLEWRYGDAQALFEGLHFPKAASQCPLRGRGSFNFRNGTFQAAHEAGAMARTEGQLSKL